MNDKQIKKWVAISFTLCFVFLMIPTIWSTIGKETVRNGVATVTSRIGGTVAASLILVLLVFMIYSDEIIFYFDKRGSGGKT